MTHVLFIYIDKKFWILAHSGTKFQCEKSVKTMNCIYYFIAKKEKGLFNIPVNSIEKHEKELGGLKYLDYESNFNNKLDNQYWVEIRLSSDYYKQGEVYQHLIKTKYHKLGKLVSKVDKYLSVISNTESYLAMGVDSEAGMRMVQAMNPYIRLYVPTTGGEYEYNQKGVFKISVLIFESYNQSKKIEQTNLF